MRNLKAERRPRTALAVLGILWLLSFGTLGASAAPAPSSPPSPLSLQQLFKQSAPAVVLITQYDANGKWTSLGSGFLISSSGVIVTNHHVIAPDQGAVRIAVKLPKGDVYTDVHVIYADDRRDFALLSIRALGLPTLKVGDSDKVEVGDRVVAIGNPMGLELTFTEGIVESVRLDPSKGYRFIQHQAPISPGSSGGPLLNMSGEVIGVNTFHFKDAQNLNGAVPINYVKPYFGDAAKSTWEQYAHISATPPPPQPAPVTPPPATTPPPSPPPAAPPAPPVRSGPGIYFESAVDYRRANDSFKLGYSSAVNDMISLFASVAQEENLSSQMLLTFFQCLDGQGDKLGQLSDWIDSTARGSSAVAQVIATACHFPSGGGTYFEWPSDYPSASSEFKYGFAAGVYDTVSLVAKVAQPNGIDSERMIAVSKCVGSRGQTLGEFKHWVDTAMAGASPNSSAVSPIVGVCLP